MFDNKVQSKKKKDKKDKKLKKLKKMGLFVKPITSTPLPENTQQIARDIYDLLAAGKTMTEIFVEDGYKMAHIEWVWNTAKKLEADAIASIIANPAFTDVEWANSVSTQLLDKIQVLQDIIDYNPDYDASRDFDGFKAAMTS